MKIYITANIAFYEYDVCYVGTDKDEAIRVKLEIENKNDSAVIDVWENGKHLGPLEDDGSIKEY